MWLGLTECPPLITVSRASLSENDWLVTLPPTLPPSAVYFSLSLISPTHPLSLLPQIITAVYFCMIDTVMMSQFLYYVVKNQGRRGGYSPPPSPFPTPPPFLLSVPLTPSPCHFPSSSLLSGLLRMFLGPEKKKGQVAAVLLPGLICTMLLASWPHLNAVVGPGSLDDSYSLGTTRSGRVLLHIRENTKNALNVHVRAHNISPRQCCK